MKFNVTVIDPAGYRCTHFLFPLCKLLCCGLESLGHDCSITRNAAQRGRMPIIVGGHLLTSRRDVDAIAASGEYIVYQTENFENGVVDFVGRGNCYESVYVPLLARARTVWEIVSPAQVTMIANFGGRPHRLLGGYHPDMEEVTPKRNKDIDFLFFGSMTPHRHAMLEMLRKRGHEIVTIQNEADIFRNDFIARSKVHLAPKYGEQRDHFPWPRHMYLLNNKCLIVSEKCKYQEWLEDCFLWAPTEPWAELCEQTLARSDREQLALSFHERFKQRPFTNELQQALDAM